MSHHLFESTCLELLVGAAIQGVAAQPRLRRGGGEAHAAPLQRGAGANRGIGGIALSGRMARHPCSAAASHQQEGPRGLGQAIRRRQDQVGSHQRPRAGKAALGGAGREVVGHPQGGHPVVSAAGQAQRRGGARRSPHRRSSTPGAQGTHGGRPGHPGRSSVGGSDNQKAAAPPSPHCNDCRPTQGDGLSAAAPAAHLFWGALRPPTSAAAASEPAAASRAPSNTPATPSARMACSDNKCPMLLREWTAAKRTVSASECRGPPARAGQLPPQECRRQGGQGRRPALRLRPTALEQRLAKLAGRGASTGGSEDVPAVHGIPGPASLHDIWFGRSGS